MKKHVKKIKKASQTHKIPALLFAVIFAGLGAYILTITHAASAATISLSPATTTVSHNGNFTVTVLVNSGTDDVNTAEADLNFDPAKLQFVSTDHSTSTLDSPITETQDPNDTSLVRVTSGDSTPGHGQQTLGTVTFKAIGTGSANISIRSTSLVFLQTPQADGTKQILSLIHI